jgi:heme-degrading monooxygenase HmoA
MIARSWSAITTPDKAPLYAQHLRSSVLPQIAAIDGYEGAMLLTRETGGSVELLVLTLWRSSDAIRAFTGGDLERAVVAAEAAALLTDFDRRVKHYDVTVQHDG